MTEDPETSCTLTPGEADIAIANGNAQYDWYIGEAKIAKDKLARVTWAGILIGLSASAIAAVPGSVLGDRWAQITRGIVAVLTLFVTLFSGTLTSKYRRLAVMRENGRIATARENNTTRVGLQNHAMTRRERGDILVSYEARLIDIDKQHGTIDPLVATSSQDD